MRTLKNLGIYPEEDKMDNVVELVVANDVPEGMAKLNVTWSGCNGDLPDPIPYDATDAEIRQMATESVESGYIPGIPADPNADVVDFEFRLEDLSYDVCIWSESIYYLGATLSVTELYDLMGKIIGKLQPAGLLVMANSIELPADIPESEVTKRSIIDSYYSLISSLANAAMKSIYAEEKMSRIYEYQLWIFQR